MSDIVYPIECFNDQQLEATENRIFDWLATGIRVHFLYHDHQLSCTQEGFYKGATGLHPSMRFIFITPALEMDVNALVAVFNLNYPPQDGDEYADRPTSVGDRRCPLCGHI